MSQAVDLLSAKRKKRRHDPHLAKLESIRNIALWGGYVNQLLDIRPEFLGEL